MSPHHLQDEGPLVAGKAVKGTCYHSQQESVLIVKRNRDPAFSTMAGTKLPKADSFSAKSKLCCQCFRTKEYWGFNNCTGGVLFLEMGSHTPHTDLELILCVAKGGYTEFWSFCLHIQEARTTGLHHHLQMCGTGKHLGLPKCLGKHYVN